MVNILNRLSRSPAGRSLLAELEADEVVDERASAIAELARLEQERSITLPPLEKAEAAAIALVAQVQDALEVAKGQQEEASLARFRASNQLTILADRQRAILRGLTPEALDKFRKKLNAATAPKMPNVRNQRELAIAEAASAAYLAEVRTQRVAAEALNYADLNGAELEEKLSAMQQVLDELAARAASLPDQES